MLLAPRPEATTFPIGFFLTDDWGQVSQGEIRNKNVDIRRVNFPRGFSTLQLSVKAKDSDQNNGPSSPVLAELEEVEISDIEFKKF